MQETHWIAKVHIGWKEGNAAARPVFKQIIENNDNMKNSFPYSQVPYKWGVLINRGGWEKIMKFNKRGSQNKRRSEFE